jgi:hypothetical protein
MSANTTFEIDKAEKLKAALQRTKETVQQDWQSTTSTLNNLKSLWNDNQRLKADPVLEKLIANYQTIELELDRHLQSISEQIRIAQNRQEKLDSLKK